MKNATKITNLRRCAIFCGCLLLFACFAQAQPDNQSTLPKTFLDLEAYPSPLEGQSLAIALNVLQAGDFTCTVRDQLGWVVIDQKVSLSAGRQEFTLDFPLPGGMYYLTVRGKSERYEVKKIVKAE